MMNFNMEAFLKERRNKKAGSKTFKQLLKDEIVRLTSTPGVTEVSSILISRDDYRLLTWEISKQETFEDVTIVIDDVKILAGRDMPIKKDKRFELLKNLH